MDGQAQHHHYFRFSSRAKIIIGYGASLSVAILAGIFLFILFSRLSLQNEQSKTAYEQLQTYIELQTQTTRIENLITNDEQRTDTEKIQEEIRAIGLSVQKIQPLSPEQAKRVTELKDASDAYIKEVQTFLEQSVSTPEKPRTQISQIPVPASLLTAQQQFVSAIQNNRENQNTYYLTTYEKNKQNAIDIGYIVIGAIVVLFVFSFGAACLIYFYVISPLNHIFPVIKEIQKGNLKARVPVLGYDEIGQLASGFNDMVTHMQLIYSQMEETVSQKTKELEEKVQSTEKQNSVLEETKRAMLNLLEDARRSEEKVQEQSEQVKKALSETERLAHVASVERNTYLLLISSIGEGVVVLDLENKITIVNRVTEEIMGYKADEMIGKSFFELFTFLHRDNTPLEQAFWDKALVAHEPILLPPDISVKLRDGQLVPVAEVVSPIVDRDTEEHKGVIITFRDVREERALEDARISFISVASHQLRTPLTSMRWFSEMLLGGDAGQISEEQRHFVERIYQGTDRMIALVNLLLQIARVEAGRVKIEPAPVDLKTTTNGVLLTLKTLLDKKKQTVNIITDPDPFPNLSMDQEVIWQVIQNLLSNALRYSPNESPITVKITKNDTDAEYSVEDHGIGIPKDQKDRMFEKFFRAENALKLVPEGSGLGLSLVKLLVEGWNGKIWFDSEEGKGTTFHFTIPLTGMKAREGEVKLAV